MPELTGPLTPQGAVLDILIGLSAADVRRLRLALQPIPQPLSLQALIDTGASHTSVDAKAFQPLGLQPSNFIVVSTASASALPRAQFEVSLRIVHPSGNSQLDLLLESVTVTDADLLPNQLPALIGCDLLALWVFKYDGPAREFTLDY